MSTKIIAVYFNNQLTELIQLIVSDIINIQIETDCSVYASIPALNGKICSRLVTNNIYFFLIYFPPHVYINK